MDYKDAIYIVLAVLTILSFYFNRTKEAKEDSGLIIRLTATLENLSSEVSRLNRNVESLTQRTNESNSEVGILDNKVKSLHLRVDELTHKIEELERYVYGGKDGNN